jgi:CRP-like cAMP-binding protein
MSYPKLSAASLLICPSSNTTALDLGVEIPACQYPPHAQLFVQGTPSAHVYLLDAGLVKLSRLEADGGESFAGMRAAGSVLGACAAILGDFLDVSATTVARCELRRMSTADFVRLLEDNHEVARKVRHLQSQEIRKHRLQISDLIALPARKRLEELLWSLLERSSESRPSASGSQNGTLEISPKTGSCEHWLQMPFGSAELAQILAVTPEHLSQLLRKLESQKLICRWKGRITVLKPEELWHRESTPWCSTEVPEK